jgi:hypothetical protein
MFRNRSRLFHSLIGGTDSVSKPRNRAQRNPRSEDRPSLSQYRALGQFAATDCLFQLPEVSSQRLDSDFRLLPTRQLERFGSCGMSQLRKACWLRVCRKRSPGPWNSQTNPSPPKIVDFNPPTLRTW